MKVRIYAVAFFTVTFLGCATIPGKTRQEQVQTVDDLVARTLTDLENQHPRTKEEIAQSVGYVIMNNKITKIPIVGAGAGYGVAIDNKSGEKIFLRMTRFDLGAGWGARTVRPVLIFHDDKKFQRFVDGAFEAKMTAEASAKVGDTGAAGGTGGHQKDSAKTGYSAYCLTDAGVSATWSVGVIRVKPVKIKAE